MMRGETKREETAREEKRRKEKPSEAESGEEQRRAEKRREEKRWTKNFNGQCWSSSAVLVKDKMLQPFYPHETHAPIERPPLPPKLNVENGKSETID